MEADKGEADEGEADEGDKSREVKGVSGKEKGTGVFSEMTPVPFSYSSGNNTLIKIIPSTGKIAGKPDSFIKVFCHPDTGKLDPKFSPTIHYNTNGGFAALGKELWHAWQQIGGGIVPNADTIKWDLDAVPQVKNVLQNEYDEIMKK